MRKLLLTTTALATVASFSALADMNGGNLAIKGAIEFQANSVTSKGVTLDGSNMGTDSEIAFVFTNKTASGLTVAMTTELRADDGDTAIDEGSLSISGGFGTFILGGNDGAADMMNLEAEDVMSEEASPIALSASIATDTDVSLDAVDDQKVTYVMKPMGGLKTAVSYTNGKTGTAAAGERATVSAGAQYAMSFDGAALTFAATNAVKEGAMGKADSEHNGIGLKLVTGNLTVIAASADKDSIGDNIEASGVGASYKVSDATVLSVYSMSSSDSLDVGETYDNTGVEVKYSIASGLNAILTFNDFEYKKGVNDGVGVIAGTPIDDSGSSTKLTIQASF